MPMYSYSNADQTVVEDRFYLVGKAPKSIEVNGETLNRDFSIGTVNVPPTKGWPMECCASGVLRESEIKPRQEHLAKHGVSVDFVQDRSGVGYNPVYRDKDHKNRALSAIGLQDQSTRG